MHTFNKLFFLLIISVFTIVSCKKDEKKIDVSTLKSNVEVIRFDQLFSAADTTTFPKLKAKFPFLFPSNLQDHEWLAHKNDTLFQTLYRDAQETFGDFDKQTKGFENLFKHVKHYYPTFKEPKIITLISILDYDSQVIYADSLLLISLDTYLGKDKYYYGEYPNYLRYKLQPNRLIIDAAHKIAEETVPKIPFSVFIERIVTLGKIEYATQLFLPNTTEGDILGIDPKHMEWLFNNEYYIWQYFMEKEYIYSADKDLVRRFIDPAPFSKFYIETDTESPGQVGIWLGLQIVKRYMQFNKVSLSELMATPPMDVFKKSKYKPTK